MHNPGAQWKQKKRYIQVLSAKPVSTKLHELPLCTPYIEPARNTPTVTMLSRKFYVTRSMFNNSTSSSGSLNIFQPATKNLRVTILHGSYFSSLFLITRQMKQSYKRRFVFISVTAVIRPRTRLDF